METRLKAYGERVDLRLAQLLPSEKTRPLELHEAMRYSCLAPGKRLRPALCLASAEAVSGAPFEESLLEAACALEMVHCFSLIHDDLPAIDDDSLRRGLPTCHVKYGEALALLAGDALFALAFEALSLTRGPTDRVLRSLQSLAKATGSDGLVGGEVMDVLSEGKPPDKETLEFIHSRKTGSLISASCEIGALLGGGSEKQVQQLKGFGAKVGLAFQIVDDLLNETSTAAQLGKATGSDREKSKATYPALYGLDGAKRAAGELLASAIGELGADLKRREALVELAEFSVERIH